MGDTLRSQVLAAGRILLALLFLLSGIRKILYFAPTVGFTAKAGLPMPEVLIVLTILLELGGAVLLILGYQARLAALALAAFVAIATPIFHAYWSAEPAQYGNQFNHFWKNLSIVGGLLYVWACGAGALSIDGRLSGPTGAGMRSTR